MSTQPITINIPLTLDQLLMAIRQLNKPARVQVARVLVETETELDAELDALIRHIAEGEPAEDIRDELINAEVRAVRLAHRQR